MEQIKTYIITLVTAIIFITAVEIIAPEKPIKKYIKFVLGVIFLSVMINPIIYLLTKGETEVLANIKKYEVYFKGEMENKYSDLSNDTREVAFKENLNKNCEKMLKDNFGDMAFKPDIECSFNFDTMTYSIDKVDLGVKDKSVRLIEKIKININSSDSKEAISKENNIEKQEEIIDYLMNILNVPREKIEIYSLEG